MRRKVKKSLAGLLATLLVLSTVLGGALSVFAEDRDLPETLFSETEESSTETMASTEEIFDSWPSETSEEDFVISETDGYEMISGIEENLSSQTIWAAVYDSNAEITLSGLMPEGAFAEAYPVEVEIEGQKVLAAYDITIYDINGNVFQPEDGAIRVEIADAAVTEALDEEEDISVYHMENMEAWPEQIEEVVTENQVVAFDAESFSIYVVTTPETHYTWTYTFHNGESVCDTQILSDGETLLEPDTPVKDKMIFDGWYTAETGGERFSGFGVVNVGNVSGTTDLYARYKEAYYVFYKASTDESSKVLYTQKYSKDASIVTTDVPFNTGDVNKALIGWSKNPTADSPDENLKIENGDVTLYPVVKEAHWITYDSQGGSFVNPVYVLAGGNTSKPSEPTRIGYSFAGWYKDAECKESYTFGSTLNENITLYAKWNPAQTSYTVIFWQQQVTDDKNASNDEKKYDYKSSETRQATTGSEVSVTNSDRQKNYTGFVYNSAKQTTATVAADGSTVLNVYYDRQLMTMEFYSARNRGTLLYTYTGLYGSTLASNGYTWPSDDGWIHYQGTSSNGTTMTFLDAFLFPAEVGNITTMKFYKQAQKSYKVIHYKQTLDGSWEEAITSYGGGGKFNFSNKYNGFTVSQYSTNGRTWNDCTDNSSIGSYNTLYVRHTRNSYTLDYSNGTAGVVKSESIKFEQELNGYADYVPERPLNLANYYTFQGWYKDPECTEKFDFSQTMPANNLVVYAKWAPKQVTVTFDMNAGESEVNPIEPQTFDSGKTAEKPENPTREGYSFAGWTRNGEPFNFATQITENTTLVAQWISEAEYTITYAQNIPDMEEPGTISDDTKYADGAEAKVFGVPENWTAPEESKGFICWNTEADGLGDDYYPGDVYTMPPHDVTLYAKWAEVRKTTLTYDFNGGVGVDEDGQTTSKTEDIDEPNSPYAIDGPEVTKEGYELIGWSTSRDGSNGVLQNGEVIQIDTLKSENNILYAQWKELPKKVTVTKIVDGNMGDKTKEFEFTYKITKENENVTSGSFKLKDGASYSIENVEVGSTVTVTEVSPTVDGYTTEVTIGDAAGNNTTMGTIENIRKDTTIVFKNVKNVNAPTGIVRNIWPFVMMIFVAIDAIICFVVLYLKKRIR